MERPACTGEGADGDHCCYVAGERCPNLVENQGGRRYACGALLKYGSWEAMATSPEYKPIGDHWESNGHGFNYCETFDPAFCCRPEYRLGRANQHTPLPDPVVV
jgi:hypothetical protein